jgi:SAM-dependent methyltransferase
MSPDEIWLAATWPFVHEQLPPAPARVIELGCGESGGHIQALLAAGYDATGVDPQAPAGPAYRRIPFEEYRAGGPADAVVASLSLHHVADPGAVLDHIGSVLRMGGTLVVLEWGWETFDEATARWCFGHQLRQPGPGTWLADLRADWAGSGLAWQDFCRNWAEGHGLHQAAAIQAALAGRFAVRHHSSGPYYFPELADADMAAEQAAIDAGEITAGCLRFAGRA